jgi:putative hydrolase of the HAD superfamily
LLGLLTNGAADLQRRKIEGAGIGKYFDQVLISGETGWAKPDQRAFELMLSRLGSRTEHTLMIGDRLSTDIVGAQGAGIRAVWVNRSRKEKDSPVVPNWEISSLDEVNSILAELNQLQRS